MALSAYAGHLTTTTAAAGNTVVVSGLGFQPKVVIFYYVGRSGAVDAVGRASHFSGFGFCAGTADRRACCFNSIDAAAAGDASHYHTDAAAIVSCDNAGAIDGALDLQSFDTDGFTLVIDDAFPRDQRVGFLALGGDDITNAATGLINVGTPTGNLDITVGFQPDVVFFFGIGLNTDPPAGGVDASGCFGLAVSASQQFVWEGLSDDGSATMDTESYCNDLECLAMAALAGGGLSHRSSFVGMISTGFTINRLEQTAVGRRFHYLAIKGGRYAAGSVLTQMDTVTDIVVSGLAFQPRGGLLVSHCKAESTQDTVQDHNELSVGAFSSASQRNAQALLDEHSVADAEVSTALEFDAVYANISTASAIEGLMDVKSVDAGGVTFIMDDADPAQSFVGYLLVGDAPVGGGPVASRMPVLGVG
jgi:hypothetical protein